MFDINWGNLLSTIIFDYALKIIIILFIGIIANKVGAKLINLFIKQREKLTKFVPGSGNRLETVGKLLENVWMYFIYLIMALTILPIFGVEIGPILASAGVLGLAIGFGAQALVKDTVTGFFILLEGQFGVGDVVVLNGVEGKVTNFGLRTTTLETTAGDVFYISNGMITQLTNKSQATSGTIEGITEN